MEYQQPPGTRFDPKTDPYGRHVCLDPGIVIGCCSRSGSSLLRSMLDSHPRLAVGQGSRLFVGVPEIERLVSRYDVTADRVLEFQRQAADHAHFLELFLRDFCQREDKAIWGDKAPPNVYYIPHIFEHFPNARFIHVIRDGRDVIASLRTHPKYTIKDGKTVETGTWRPLSKCITPWINYVKRGLDGRGCRGYHELHYEDLVQEPEATMRRLLEFLGEEWSDEVLEYHRVKKPTRDFTLMPDSRGAEQPVYTTAMGRWRNDLSDEDITAFKRQAGPLLIELGYEPNNDW